MKPLTFTLPEAQWGYIREVLAQRPWIEVSGIMNALAQQNAAQQKAAVEGAHQAQPMPNGSGVSAPSSAP